MTNTKKDFKSAALKEEGIQPTASEPQPTSDEFLVDFANELAVTQPKPKKSYSPTVNPPWTDTSHPDHENFEY